MRVLIADDEAAVRDALRRVLEHDGYDVESASRGDEALARSLEGGLDLIVLDVMMPEPDGLEVCRTLRGRDVQTPILMLTARGELADRVAGLDAGADDYLAKPFELDELRARIRALLRRSRSGGKVLRFGDLSLDTESRKVLRGGRELQLTRTEHALLELFLANAGKVLSRTEIFEAVWGYDFGPLSNSLEVYVGYLRRKTEAAGEPRLLHTVRGFGYVMREEP
jgi:two-component system response regulator MprA